MRAVDVQLQTGQISEVVEVEVAAVAVKTVGAEIAGLVTGEQARELPLNGRNFLQLTLLQPGVTAQQGLNTKDKGLAGGSDVSVSGGQTTGNLWMVDGANNNDVGSNRTILVYPSVDAIEEFKIQRNNYGAEFGAGRRRPDQPGDARRHATNSTAAATTTRAATSGTRPDYFLKQQGQDAAPLQWDDFGAHPRRSDPQGQAALLLLVRVEQGQAQQRARVTGPVRRPSAPATSAARAPSAPTRFRSIR